MINLQNISIGYKNKGLYKNIYENINISAKESELIALVGANGIGKSTLLRSLVGLQKIIQGEIFISEKSISNYTKKELSKIISFVSTEAITQEHLKVIDLISLGRYPYTNWLGKLQPEDMQIVENCIDALNLQNLANKFMDEISDGERQRVMIARALAQDTEIIVLDEPTAFLDLANRYEIITYLKKLIETQNKTIIFSTHDLHIALKESDKIWLMANSEIFEGAPEDLILNNSLHHLFSTNALHFNHQTSDFETIKIPEQEIQLKGNGIEFQYTKKALERNNFKISEKQADIKIEIKKNEENQSIWKYENQSISIEFSSIYDLQNRLKKDKVKNKSYQNTKFKEIS